MRRAGTTVFMTDSTVSGSLRDGEVDRELHFLNVGLLARLQNFRA